MTNNTRNQTINLDLNAARTSLKKKNTTSSGHGPRLSSLKKSEPTVLKKKKTDFVVLTGHEFAAHLNIIYYWVTEQWIHETTWSCDMTAILVINRGTTHLITSLQFKFIHSKTKSVWSSDIASPLFCGCGGSSRTASGAVPKLFFYLSSYAACFAAHRTIFFKSPF